MWLSTLNLLLFTPPLPPHMNRLMLHINLVYYLRYALLTTHEACDRSINQLRNLRPMIICIVVHCKCLLTCLNKASNDASNNSIKLMILNPIFLSTSYFV